MSENIPLWLELTTAFLVLFGAGITLIGNIGLLRLKTFYDRLHAPTLGATLGTGSFLIAAILYFSVMESRLALFPLLIAVFVTITTPTALILLVRATLYREQNANLEKLEKEEKK